MSTSEESLRILREKIPLFDGFTDRELAEFLTRTSRRVIPQGELIINEGGLATKLYILVSGQAIVSKGIGPAQEIIATLNPGATVGEMGVVDCAPRSARVLASEESIVLEMQQEYFEDASPLTLGKLFRNIAMILARRIRETSEALHGASSAGLSVDAFAEMVGEIGLNEVSLPHISAQGANFEYGNFEDAIFRGASLRNADLRGADFKGALFDDGTLIGDGGAANGLRAETHGEPDLADNELTNLAKALTEDKE